MSRPPFPINWREVDKLLQSGCNGREIAAFVGLHPDTFYKRCQEEHGVCFTVYSAEKKASGEALLRAAQYNKALKGDSGMLKWLGVHRLGQKETNLNEVEEASKRGVLDAVREIQAENGARMGALSGSDVETEQPLLDQGCGGEESKVPNELGAEGIV